MARFIPDVNTRRWVVITPTRASRPSSSKDKKEGPYSVISKDNYNFHDTCPFCLGNESMTPPEISRVGSNSHWQVRVVPNKFPITDIHEVIIHSPDHLKDIIDMPNEQVERLFKVYRDRYNVLKEKGAVIIFNNKGPLSGESLVHPHSQVVVIPNQISLDSLTLEPIKNKIMEGDNFVTFCPDFSQWPYEVWIVLKKCTLKDTTCIFGAISDPEIKELASIVQTNIRKLKNKFVNLSYNYYIYPHANWYLRIIPRTTERAGFELGTGLSVNIVDPAIAAKELAGIQV